MASIGISASTQRACSSQHITKKVSAEARHHVVTPNPNVEPLKLPQKQQHHQPPLDQQRFSDARWKNGTWDLNMFVKQGRMDWDSLIVAEAKRRKFLEVYPEASRNEEAVAFRSSIIPWWAWIVHSHLPEAELLNG